MPVIGGMLPYLPFGHTLGFTHLPFEFYPILMVLVIVYLTFVEFVKSAFYRARVIEGRSRSAPEAGAPDRAARGAFQPDAPARLAGHPSPARSAGPASSGGVRRPPIRPM